MDETSGFTIKYFRLSIEMIEMKINVTDYKYNRMHQSNVVFTQSYTVRCHCNTIQYNSIFHTVQRLNWNTIRSSKS